MSDDPDPEPIAFLPALLAFVALPGVVAFLLPAAWILVSGSRIELYAGLFPVAVGVLGLLWCVRDFHVAGQGTLAPWAPPRHLVEIGLYRFSRNPMYVAVVLILGGWAVTFASLVLGGYALLILLTFHLRVVRGEEPWLARTHGAAWPDYCRRVRRWL